MEAKKQKEDREKKAKEELKQAKKEALEPKHFVSRPIHTWDSLKFSVTDTALKSREEVTPPPQPRFTPNRFVWSPQHVDDSQTPAKSVERKVEPSDIVDHPPKSDSAKSSKLERTGRSKKRVHDENPLVHIRDAAQSAAPEPERVESQRNLVLSDEMTVFEAIETDDGKNVREDVRHEVETPDARPMIDQSASPLSHPIYGFPGNWQPMPAMMSIPGMQSPGYWMFHPQYGWMPCVYQ
jgi:hypothetical protein